MPDPRDGLAVSGALTTADTLAVLVDDEAIRGAQATLWRVLRGATEPGSATAFAALLSGAYRPAGGERVGIVLCGSNTDAVSF